MVSESSVPEWIDQPEALRALAERLQRTQRLAIDTEADGFHAYRPRLCLIQVAWERQDRAPGVALIDARALAGALSPFAELLFTPTIEKIMHGADYDIRLLWRDVGAQVHGLFDTQIAARVVGQSRTGLAALAEEYAGVVLDKSQQTIDWSSRPLPARALAYAALDVVCLFAVRDALGSRVEQLNRRAWVSQMCRRQETERSLEEPRSDVAYLLEKVSEARRLDPRARAVLGALLEWREAEASRRNRPAFKICESSVLLKLAQGAVEGSVAPLSLLPERLSQRYGEAIARQLAVGFAGPEMPRVRREPARVPSADERRRLTALKSVRERVARELGVEIGLIASTASLEWIAREFPNDPAALNEAGLYPWQIELLGGRLIAAIAAEAGEGSRPAVSSPPGAASGPLPALDKESDE